MKTLLILGSLIVVCIGVAPIFRMGREDTRIAISSSPTPAPTLPPHVEKDVRMMERKNWVRLDLPRRRAYIAPGIWRGLDAEGKEAWTRTLAVYLAGPGNVPHAEIYDARSGRKLASYVVGFGLEDPFTVER